MATGSVSLWKKRRREAFAAFDAGKSNRDVMSALRIGKTTSHRWRHEWRRERSRNKAAVVPAPYPGARNLFGW